MIVGYVAKFWGFDPREIDPLAGLPPSENFHPFTLLEVAAHRGVPGPI